MINRGRHVLLSVVAVALLAVAMSFVVPSGHAATGPQGPPADSHQCPTGDVCGFTGYHEDGTETTVPNENTKHGCQALPNDESVDNNSAIAHDVFEGQGCTGTKVTVQSHGTVEETQPMVEDAQPDATDKITATVHSYEGLL